MKRNIKYFVIAVLTGMTLASCNWFDVETRNILTEEQTYSSKGSIECAGEYLWPSSGWAGF